MVIAANGQTVQVISFSTEANGTTTATNLSSLPEQIELEDLLAELTYDYSYLTDTTDLTQVKNSMMLVQVGYVTTKYCSYSGMLIDSLLAVTPIEEIAANPSKFAKEETVELYKNYPVGKITTIDRVSLDWIRCKEDIPSFDWELKGETREIMGYSCRKAEWSHGGRHWIAWYTEEIPVGVGPWKLDGLPGAIVEAQDSEGHYTFKLIGVDMNPKRKMTLTDIKFLDVSVKKYYKAKRNFFENPLAILGVNGVNMTIVDNSTGKTMSETDIIRPMKYDFIERF